MNLSKSPQKAAVLCKPHHEARAVLQRVTEALRRGGTAVQYDDNAARALGLPGGLPRDEAVRGVDFVVSVGGDGTLLSAARAIGPAEIPLLGVNLGTLGFLTATRCEDIREVLDAILAGRAQVESRRALQVIRDGPSPRPDGIALNDVVFSKHDMARLFSLSVIVDGEWLTDFRADGLILATPTGSTAYNLAAGGPLMFPGVEALVVTPICPHSLAQRPLILPNSSRIGVRLADGQSSTNVQVTMDGQVSFPLEPGEEVQVQQAPFTVHLIRPGGRTFFATLRGKLGWGHI